MKHTFILRSASVGCIMLLHSVATFAQPYCTPAFGNCNSASNNINTLLIPGENSTEINLLNTGNAVDCYQYYNTSTVIMQQGMSYQVDMNSEDAGNNYVQAFIDFNDDFIFDATTETVGGSNSTPGQPGTTSYPITIPPGAQLGVHRLRLVLNTVDQMPNINPCPAANYPIGETNDFLVDVVAPGTICSPVTNLTSSAVTPTTATLSWTGVTGSIGYEYVLDQTSANPSTAGTPIAATSYNASLLTPATLYYMHVRNNCGGGEFSNWTTIGFTTTGTPSCAPVTNVIVSNVLATSATIQWTAAVGSIGYQYIINQIATAPTVAGTPIGTTTYSATMLTPNTSYYVHVRNNCGGGEFSTWVSKPFTTLPVGIDDVTNTNTTINVFPNPATDMITVKTAEAPSGKAEILITDVAGKIVKQVSLSAGTMAISLRDLCNGIYLLRYTGAGNTQVIKINKQ